MQEIRIFVAEKTAQVSGAPAVVCGNSDYTVRFTFDAEWEPYPIKTARFVYVQDGVRRYRDVLFTGSSVRVPVMQNTDAVAVGVYAGNIRTTTPAHIPCMRSITDGAPTHSAPAQDVYRQLLEYLESEPVQKELCTGIAELCFAGGDRSETGIVEHLGTVDMTAYPWERGTGDEATGQFTKSSTTRLRCLSYVNVPDGASAVQMRARSASGEQLVWSVYFYGAENRYISATDWTVYGAFVTVPAGTETVRFLLRRQNNTANISADELSGCDVMFL